MEYYAAIKRNEKLPFGTTWMELEGIKSIRERQLSYDLPDMRKWRCNVGGLRGRKRINETRWDREGDKPQETLNVTKQTEGGRGEGG